MTSNWLARTLHREARLLAAALALLGASPSSSAADALVDRHGAWIGTWATAPQPPFTGPRERYQDQTLRLVVHTSAAGRRVRIRLSNTFGDKPLRIAAAHIALRSAGPDIDASSDRVLTFGGQTSVAVPARSTSISDPVELDVPALSDLAVSLFLREPTVATTTHALALQTSYVSSAKGDHTAAAHLPTPKAIDSWPFLTGVDVEATAESFTVVAFGDSIIDGDGSAADANHRWPDVLAARLQGATPQGVQVGVINKGIIGNRLVFDSPRGASNPGGPGFGPSGLARFERDVLQQAGAKVVIVSMGLNDIGLPGAIAPLSERASAEQLIARYRELIARAKQNGMRVIGMTMGPFENAAPVPRYYSPAKDAVRQQLNAWIRSSGEFDAVLDLDEIVRDPAHPTQLLKQFDSGDHLHPNDAGYAAFANAIPLSLFGLH